MLLLILEDVFGKTGWQSEKSLDRPLRYIYLSSMGREYVFIHKFYVK
jgi:hypothetical protein